MTTNSQRHWICVGLYHFACGTSRKMLIRLPERRTAWSGLLFHYANLSCDAQKDAQKGSGLFYRSSSWSSRSFETKTNGTASGPLIITERQSATDAVSKRCELCLCLHLIQPRTPVAWQRRIVRNWKRRGWKRRGQPYCIDFGQFDSYDVNCHR